MAMTYANGKWKVCAQNVRLRKGNNDDDNNNNHNNDDNNNLAMMMMRNLNKEKYELPTVDRHYKTIFLNYTT